MATFPTTIFAEILSKLPVKSLFPMKLVCKSWYSLIKSPYFIKLHLNQTLISNSDRYLLKSSIGAAFYYAKLDLPHNYLSFSTLEHPLEYEEVEVFGACNGVVCISNYDKIDVFLYNPLTKSRRKLPPKRIPNPEKDCVLFGFGYDSKSDDYKVLRILQGFSCQKCCYDEAQVYSLNNNAWKSVAFVSKPYFFPFADCHGVLVNEGLHYIVSSEELDSQQRKMIACFDLRTEKFSLMDCPLNDDKSKTEWEYLEFCVRELGGCLAVMVTYLVKSYAAQMLPYLDGDDVRNRRLLRADLWVMKEYGNKESWVKLFSTGKPVGVKLYCTCIRPIVYSKDGRRVLIDIDCLEVGWYDLESKTYEKVDARGLPQTYYDTGYFAGSLVSLEYKPQPIKITKNKNKNKNTKKKDSDRFLSAGFKLKL
ncbi:F-box protein CPR1 [Bienertia sinuspersici]